MISAKLKSIQDCKGRLKEFIGDEGILSLAKEGICPHYVLKNPSTQEESIWFVPSELNEWIEKNFLLFNEGFLSQKYCFIHFDKTMHKAVGSIPRELESIEDLYELPMQAIYTPPGIYFLCRDAQIQYVGQSTNVLKRILTHISEGVKDFDSVYFITCPKSQLDNLEKELINCYKPPLNKVAYKYYVSPPNKN
jgi:hypothetical protein